MPGARRGKREVEEPKVTRRLAPTRSRRFARSVDTIGEAPLPQRVLVRMPNWVGDACMAMPFLQALRAQLPDALIVALARPGPDGIARLAPVDEVVLLEDRGPLWVRPWRLRRAGAMLRGYRFDAAVSLPTTTSSALLLRMAGIRRTVGYGRGAARFLFSEVLEWKPAREMHRARVYLQLLKGLGLEVPELAWDPPAVPEAARARGEERLAPLGSARPRIGLGIGSMASSRRWPAAQWVELALRLKRELGAGVVLLGGPGDRGMAAEIHARVDADVLNLAGQTQVDEMPGILASLDLMVSNDSGSAHMAALSRLPTVVFFGAGDPKITAPPWDGCRVVSTPVDCAPCLKNTCRFQLECLTGISPQRVVDEVRQLIAKQVLR